MYGIFPLIDDFQSYISEKNINKESDYFNIQTESDDLSIEIESLNINAQKKNKNANADEDENIFKTNYITFDVLKKNQSKGRKKNSDNSLYYGKCHNKYSKDNITSKIQVNYISFIYFFVNIVLEELNINHRFKKINYKFKKNVNQNHILQLKNSTIGKILCQEISPKYTKNNGDNKKVFEKLKNMPIIKDILFSNYLSLFQIYKEGIKNIQIKNININLADKKIKMYKDIEQKYDYDSNYLDKLKEYIDNYTQ